MSDTPRTDAKRVLCGYGEEMVNVDFARELERELVALKKAQAKNAVAAKAYMEMREAELQAARADNAALRADKERLDWLIQSLNIRYPYYKSGDLNSARAAIDAARAALAAGGAK